MQNGTEWREKKREIKCGAEITTLATSASSFAVAAERTSFERQHGKLIDSLSYEIRENKKFTKSKNKKNIHTYKMQISFLCTRRPSLKNICNFHENEIERIEIAVYNLIFADLNCTVMYIYVCDLYSLSYVILCT